MLSDEKYNKVLDSGLIIDHYLLLCNMKNNVAIGSNKRIKGFMNLLKKKGYIDEGGLTQKGLDFTENCEFTHQVVTTRITVKKEISKANEWMVELHKKCQEKLVALTGNSQVKAKLHGKSYNFLPNVFDFVRFLNRTVNGFKLKDHNKIEKTILSYIDKCKNAGNWFPLMQYYINKDSSSQMVTDMENAIVGPSEDKQFEIKKGKDLFE